MKAITLVLCILALLGSAASGYFWMQVGNQKAELQQQLTAEQSRATVLSGNLDETKAELEKTQAALTQSDAERGDVKSKLTAAEARNVQISREASVLKASFAAKEDSEKKLSDDLDKLRRELVQTRLAAQVGNPEEIENYQKTIAALETRLASFTGATVPSAPASGTAAGAATPASANLSERTAAARVAKVGTKNAFVVLELGAADGILPGNKFLITRVGETVAESVISEVHEAYAIAQIFPTSIKSDVKVGDVAGFTR